MATLLMMFFTVAGFVVLQHSFALALLCFLLARMCYRHHSTRSEENMMAVLFVLASLGVIAFFIEALIQRLR